MAGIRVVQWRFGADSDFTIIPVCMCRCRYQAVSVPSIIACLSQIARPPDGTKPLPKPMLTHQL